VIDLNEARAKRLAAAREGRGEGVPVAFGAGKWMLPAEVPADVLQRLLDPDVEVAQLLVVALRAYRAGTDRAADTIIEVLTDQPNLPHGFVRAVLDAIESLFGPEQWAAFRAEKPSLQDLWALVSGLFREYGVGLGEALRSRAPSPNGGTTSSPTSLVSIPDSTPATSGPDEATPDTSASVA
jgi:hypothetical protein